MKTVKETYSLFLAQDFIEDYLPDVELPSPHLQFEHLIPAYFFKGNKKKFSSKEEENEFLEAAKEAEMDNIANYSMNDLFGYSNREPYRQLANLLKIAGRDEADEVLAYEEIYFDDTKSKIELEFVE